MGHRSCVRRLLARPSCDVDRLRPLNSITITTMTSTATAPSHHMSVRILAIISSVPIPIQLSLVLPDKFWTGAALFWGCVALFFAQDEYYKRPDEVR